MANTPQRDKWVDPRTPVLVEKVGKFTVTIYDLEAYNASLLKYPDDNKKSSQSKAVKYASYPLPVKAKPASRYKWIEPLEHPLGLTAHGIHKAGKG
jgi:hypothetical protein